MTKRDERKSDSRCYESLSVGCDRDPARYFMLQWCEASTYLQRYSGTTKGMIKHSKGPRSGLNPHRQPTRRRAVASIRAPELTSGSICRLDGRKQTHAKTYTNTPYNSPEPSSPRTKDVSQGGDNSWMIGLEDEKGGFSAFMEKLIHRPCTHITRETLRH